jgi:CheY-like chemotaxis protein
VALSLARNPAPILVSDVSTDPSLGPRREAILAEGIHPLGFIPLGHHGQLLGKFMVYYDKPHAFSDVDLKIAAMVAHYVAFGLDRVRAQAAIEGLVVMALRALGVDVQAAKSGRAGIELVLRGRPDHVLVDIGLPDLDGYEVCRALRLRVGQAIKLVALTGYGQQVDRERSADAGFDAHVVKPVGPRELLRLLEGA